MSIKMERDGTHKIEKLSSSRKALYIWQSSVSEKRRNSSGSGHAKHL